MDLQRTFRHSHLFTCLVKTVVMFVCLFVLHSLNEKKEHIFILSSVILRNALNIFSANLLGYFPYNVTSEISSLVEESHRPYVLIPTVKFCCCELEHSKSFVPNSSLNHVYQPRDASVAYL